MNPLQQSPIILTIDGPSGSGKSSVAKNVAQQLKFHHLDSGAIYRSVTWALYQQNKVDDIIQNSNQLTQFLNQLEIIFKADEIFCNGQEISQLIRHESIGLKTSTIASIAIVREKLLSLQRSMVEMPGLVADGRDMGSIVFPQAHCKIYLTASVQQRAKRRFLQLKQNNQKNLLEDIKQDIEKRDELDINRECSPLVIPENAITINSDELTLEQVCQNIIKQVQTKL